MTKRLTCLFTGIAVLGITDYGNASVPVEQIEAYESTPTSPTFDPYAPVNFAGAPDVTVSGGGNGGQFDGIIFNANIASGLQQTVSGHAQTVGDYFYGSAYSPAYPYVNSVYDLSASVFLNSVLAPHFSTGIGALPSMFAGGAKVINNSYVGSASTSSANLDDNRRIDYMTNQADVVWVAGAVTNGIYLPCQQYQAWSNFNGLAVTGAQSALQSFNPVGSPGKQHADLSIPTTDASFASAEVSGYAAALWGNAATNNQADAQHGAMIRSLLMTGASKGTYIRPINVSSGALDPLNGAGQPDYTNSLSILDGGEKQLLTAGAAGPVATSQQGWSSGNVSAGGQSVVLFQSANTMFGLTASLNWNVTSPTVGTTQLDTSSVIFPNLGLEVRPVSYNSGTGQYSLGASIADATLHGASTIDNVRYLYTNSTLPAGTYAFLITGDPKLSASVGFSYELAGAFTSQWNINSGGSWATIGSWSNGVPNGYAAKANLIAMPGGTAPGAISLDGAVSLGQLTIDNVNGYNIAPGNGGTLKIDDSGDTTYKPAITVLSGNQLISAPLHTDWGLTTTVASGASLNISGGFTGVSNLTKNGNGVLVLSNASVSGITSINAGTISLGTATSLSAGVIVNSGGILNFAANTSNGFAVRIQQVTINAGGVTTLSTASVSGNRQVLVSTGLSIAGTPGSWTGQLDLANNDLDIPGGNLTTVISQLEQGYNSPSGGNWNGSGGILSSSAATNPTYLTTLGVMQNNQSGTALFTPTNLFDGTTPGVDDILVKYTYYGDTNLDGKVDGSDFSRIDNGYLSSGSLTGWYNGDFNYDGTIDGSDYTLIDNAFNSQGGQLTSAIANSKANATAQIAATTAVPEPSAAGLVVMSTIILLRRRGQLATCNFRH